MASEPARLISSDRNGEDADAALRPKTLAEFVGQVAAKDNLRVFIESAKSRGEAMDFVPSGESRQHVVVMLPQPAAELGRDADVKRAVVAARKNVDARDAFLPHGPECAARWTLKQIQGDEERLGLQQ